MSQCYELVETVGLACLMIGYILGCLVTIHDWKREEARRATERIQQAARSGNRIARILTGTDKDGQVQGARRQDL